MRYSRFVWLFLVMVSVIGLSVMLVSCGGGGNGGGAAGGGVTTDNTKANGTFTYVYTDASAGFTVDSGTVTFDGAGHGTFTSYASGGSGTFNYSVTVPGNTLTVNSTSTSIGTINITGNFFTVVDVTNKNILYGAKLATGVTDTYTATYLSGQFDYNPAATPKTAVGMISLATATPSTGMVTYVDLLTSNTGTVAYTIASNGTFTLIGGEYIGAISSDRNIMIYADTETSISTTKTAAVGLKLPGSGMTNASLSGTYAGFDFYDSNAGTTSPAMGITRYTLTFNGAGSGTFTVVQDSQGVTGSGPFTYVVSSDGTFTIDGVMNGVMLQDGSVIAFGDVDPAGDSYISSLIAIKR